jgi:hypothetical protein
MPKPDQSGIPTLSARNEVLYVSETAPPDGGETDPTNYTLVGLPQETPLSSEREEIRGSNKLQTFKSVHLGDGSFSMDLTCERPVERDSGQTMIRENHFADSPPSLHFLLLTFDDSGTAVEAIWGKVKVPGYDRGSSNNEKATFSATLAGDLAPTFEDNP